MKEPFIVRCQFIYQPHGKESWIIGYIVYKISHHSGSAVISLDTVMGWRLGPGPVGGLQSPRPR